MFSKFSYSNNHIHSDNEELKFPAKSSYFGPGVWLVFHQMGIKADTPEKTDEYIKMVRVMISNLPCSLCRNHASSYLEDNPPEEYLTYTPSSKTTAMFFWSWKFHNTVNMRLGKPILNIDKAISLYPEYSEFSPCPSE